MLELSGGRDQTKMQRMINLTMLPGYERYDSSIKRTNYRMTGCEKGTGQGLGSQTPPEFFLPRLRRLSPCY